MYGEEFGYSFVLNMAYTLPHVNSLDFRRCCKCLDPSQARRWGQGSSFGDSFRDGMIRVPGSAEPMLGWVAYEVESAVCVKASTAS